MHWLRTLLATLPVLAARRASAWLHTSSPCCRTNPTVRARQGLRRTCAQHRHFTPQQDGSLLPREAPFSRGSSVRLAVTESVEALFDPTTFTPVCVASDALYRQAQGLVYLLAGPDVYQEYAPLIAGALLRVRLELCVIESFVFEAVVPFVRENGISWVLPAQETVQSFLAGTVFAVAINVIFVGSTKILSLVVTFFDVFLGIPARLLAKLPVSQAVNDDADDNDPPKTKSPAVLALLLVGAFGKSLEVMRTVAEFADLFVARYLALITVVYITVKFLHFRVFTAALPF